MTVSLRAQLVLYMDFTGALRAEAPGPNGARRKIDLAPNFAKKNPDLITLLREDLEQQRAQADHIARLAAQQPASLDAIENLRTKRLNAMDRESVDRWTLWMRASVDEDKRQAEIERRVAKAKAEDDERGRRIWSAVAARHGIQLANRVVDNPNRRPRVAKQAANLALALDL